MGFAIFCGVFLAVLLSIGIGVLVVRRKIRRFSKEVLGTEDFIGALKDEDRQMNPKSVSGMDSILLPKILRDFPDFDIDMAKSYCRDYIKEKLKEKQEITIHRVVLSEYLSSQTQKTIVMQASLAYVEDEQTVQTRYELHYTFMVDSACDSVAANCPNCGAVLGYGQTVCAYCGARVVNVLGNTWEFTRMTEI